MTDTDKTEPGSDHPVCNDPMCKEHPDRTPEEVEVVATGGFQLPKLGVSNDG
jgi:hypothetical protein